MSRIHNLLRIHQYKPKINCDEKTDTSFIGTFYRFRFSPNFLFKRRLRRTCYFLSSGFLKHSIQRFKNSLTCLS